MNLIEKLGDLGQKERIRITLEDDTVIEGRINQSVYDPNGNLRLELGPDDSNGSDEYTRYQVRATKEDGSWTPPTVRGYEQGDETWTDLADVADVTSLDTDQTE